MFPVSSIGNDISSDLVRRKMNDLPESPTGNNLEALAPGIEKLKQTSIEMVTLLNTLQPGGKCIITCLLYTSPSPRDISGSRMPAF
ncbi:hypothetical protein ACX3V1_06150, partial [Escherichia coli]